MAHEWIVDVLADLRNFALQNNLNALVEQLDDTLLVAAAELSQAVQDAPEESVEYVSGVGRLPRRLAGGQIA